MSIPHTYPTVEEMDDMSQDRLCIIAPFYVGRCMQMEEELLRLREEVDRVQRLSEGNKEAKRLVGVRAAKAPRG